MSECAVTLIFSLLILTSFVLSDNPNKKDAPLWNATSTDLLKRDLLQGYDKFARPSHHKNTTDLFLEIELKYAHIDDKKFVMTANAWVKMIWNDDKLKWNVSKYNGMTYVHMADHEVWQPDMTLYNSAIGNNMDHYGNAHCIVYSDGKVLWIPPAQFTVYCDLDLTHWPFDSHACNIILGSWTYSGEHINLTTTENTVYESDLNIYGSEWKVTKIVRQREVKIYPCCTEPYIGIINTVYLTRLSSTYFSVIVLPTIGMVLMTLSLFWLPSHTQERMVLSGAILILISIFMIYFSQRLPAMGSSTPLIVMFYSYHLIMVILAIIISVVSYNLTMIKKPIPWYLQSVLRGPLAKVLGVEHHQVDYTEEMSSGDDMRYEDTRDERGMLTPVQSVKQWSTVASILDRIAFLFYLLVFSCFAIRCSF
nr:nicotinic acetylcholine receptor alpha 9 subunit [Orius laevigatus]